MSTQNDLDVEAITNALKKKTHQILLNFSLKDCVIVIVLLRLNISKKI